MTYSGPKGAQWTLSETDLVHRLVAGKTRAGFMLDVGAHTGSSLAPYAHSGWQVLAFEPDPANLAQLKRHPAARGAKVDIIQAAVGAEKRDTVPFFSSPESTGVSGLSAFLSSHREVAQVPLVTLGEVIAERQIRHVDLLKIDVYACGG